MSIEALQQAVESAGGQTALASKIGVKQSVLWYWLKKSGKGCPAERVIDVERITGISRHELRPDIYPAPTDRVSA